MVPLPVLSARENVNNGHEIFGELLRSVSNTLVVNVSIPSLIIDDQSSATCFENKLEKFEPKTDEAIPVGDNNLLDQAFDALDDQGAKTGAVEVNSRIDVFDNSPSGIFFNKVRNLSIQIS
jgi:purine-nucleoside phosphorylase